MLISGHNLIALACVFVLVAIRSSDSTDEDEWDGWMDDNHSKWRDSGEARDEMNDIMNLLQSVAHQLASLKSVVHNLKVHNQIIYKQVHKLYKNKCQNALSRKTKEHVTAWKSVASPAKEFASSDIQNHEASASIEVTKSSSCPTGFQLSAEARKCYRVESAQRVSWLLARDRCKSIGAELVSVGSAREQSIIGEMLRKKNAAKCDYWIGLTATRRTTTSSFKPSPVSKLSSSRSSTWSEGQRRPSTIGDVHWYWSGDGSGLGGYTNWNDNEPNDIGKNSSSLGPGDGGGVCVQMLWIFDWKWNDASCFRSAACFICQTVPSTAISKDALAVRGHRPQ